MLSSVTDKLKFNFCNVASSSTVTPSFRRVLYCCCHQNLFMLNYCYFFIVSFLSTSYSQSSLHELEKYSSYFFMSNDWNAYTHIYILTTHIIVEKHFKPIGSSTLKISTKYWKVEDKKYFNFFEVNVTLQKFGKEKAKRFEKFGMYDMNCDASLKILWPELKS